MHLTRQWKKDALNPSELKNQVDAWLWQRAGPEQTPAARFGRNALRVLYAVGRDLVDGKVTLHAMGLVYTTLLSIVPFLALSFSVLKGFGVHNQLRPVLENVLTDPLGERAGPIVDNVLIFVDNIEVGVLGSVGLGFLIYTVIALVQKVERSFNEIWHVSQTRSIGQRFSSYLSVIMVGPLLVFAALGATAAVVSSAAVEDATEALALGWLVALIGRIAPYALIIGLFTFLYMFIPNTRVQLRSALVGGVVAGITWQSLGFGFTLFVANADNYTAIYSGFAIGIFILIWLYLVWLILLVGASFAFYTQHSRQISKRRGAPSARLDEYVGLALVWRIGQDFEQGIVTDVADIESSLGVGPDISRRIIDKLKDGQVLSIAGENGNRLVPGRPFDRLTLSELITIIRSPDQAIPESVSSEESVAAIADAVNEAATSTLDDRLVSEWIRG